MTKTSYTITKCARCGWKEKRKNTFIEQLKEYLPIHNNGWYQLEGKDLCASCYNHFTVIKEKFFRGDL